MSSSRSFRIIYILATFALLGIIICFYTYSDELPQSTDTYGERKLQWVSGYEQVKSLPVSGEKNINQQNVNNIEANLQQSEPKVKGNNNTNQQNVNNTGAKPQQIEPALREVDIRHNGTQKPMPVSGEVEKALKIVGARSLDRPSREAVRKAVIVTAADHSHFEEMKLSIASHQAQNPGRKIVFYDLGLSYRQASQIKTWCNLEYRQFDYSLYPPHTRNLVFYAWKMFIILDVLKEYDAVIWIDTSVRFTCKEAIDMLALTAGSSGVTLPLTGFPSNFCYTHPGMYDYIASNLTIVQTTPMYGGGFIVVVNTKEMFANFIQWLVRCAFTKKCMAAGEVLICPEPKNYFNHWVGCHRYDQSALNLILLHHFKGDIGKFTSFPCAKVNMGEVYKLQTGNCK